MIRIPELTEREISISKLRREELEIEDRLKSEPKLVNGELDYTTYDELMSQLRDVRAEMASLVN